MSSACVCHTKEWCFYCEMFVPLEQELANQKAITELAVKGLKEIACLNSDSLYSAGTIARNTYFEIERLSHETNR